MRIVKTKRKRTDLEKIKSSWRKIEGPYKKEDWSSVVIRSSIATEIAMNFMINDINSERNSVAHSGQFKRETTAINIINSSKKVIETLVGRYKENFKLKDIS